VHIPLLQEFPVRETVVPQIRVKLVVVALFRLDKTAAVLDVGSGSPLYKRILNAGRGRAEETLIVLILQDTLVDALVVDEALLV